MTSTEFARPLARPVAPHALTVTVTDAPSPAMLANWARLVSDTAGSDVAQLPAWAGLRSGVGFTGRWVLVHRGHQLVGGAQVLERRVPVVGRLGYLPYGPVVAAECADDPSVLAAVCDALAELGRRRLRMLFVQPPTGAESVSPALSARGFRPSDAAVAPAATLRLDLSRDLDELRSGLAKRLRTWTNRWTARGVTVRLGTAADVSLLAEMVADSGRHQGFAAVSEEYLHTLHRQLTVPHSVCDAVLFVGEVDGTPAAVALFTRCAGVLTLRFAGMSRSEATGKLNVPAAVQWSAVQWAKRAGLRWFDFGGISTEAADVLAVDGPRDGIRGVDRFKASFGGQLYRYPPAVELISASPLRLGYDLSRRWSAGRRAVELAKRLMRTGRLRQQGS